MLKSSHQKLDPVERKLRDIEREKQRVQEEIKALSRNLKKGDVVQSPAVPTAAGGRSVFGVVDAGPGSPSTSRPPARPPAQRDERFANYFSTGGLKTPLPGPKNRSVQRNKTVFIVIVVLMLIFIVFSVVR